MVSGPAGIRTRVKGSGSLHAILAIPLARMMITKDKRFDLPRDKIIPSAILRLRLEREGAE